MKEPRKDAPQTSVWNIVCVVAILICICIALRLMTLSDGTTAAKMNLNYLFSHAKSGDLIVWSRTLPSYALEIPLSCVTGSVWNHGAIVQRRVDDDDGAPYVIMMSSDSGERSHIIRIPLAVFVETLTASDDGFRLAYSPLRSALTLEQEAIMSTVFCELHDDRAIRLHTPVGLFVAANGGHIYDPKKEACSAYRRFACSEMVAYVLRRLGILSTDLETSRASIAYYPHHLAIEHIDIAANSYDAAVEICMQDR